MRERVFRNIYTGQCATVFQISYESAWVVVTPDGKHYEDWLKCECEEVYT